MTEGVAAASAPESVEACDCGREAASQDDDIGRRDSGVGTKPSVSVSNRFTGFPPRDGS